MYDLKIAISALSVNFAKNEKYILSSDPLKITLPSFSPPEATNLDHQIADEIESFFENPSEIRTYSNNSKFISINDEHLSALFDTTNTIFLLYGITLPNAKTKSDMFWKQFNFQDQSMQHIIPIIGATIERAI